MNTENLKKMIILKFGSLNKCANALGISPSTLTRNLSNPSDKFIRKLKSIGVPLDNNSMVESITAVISKDGVEGFIVKEDNEKYAVCVHCMRKSSIFVNPNPSFLLFICIQDKIILTIPN